MHDLVAAVRCYQQPLLSPRHRLAAVSAHLPPTSPTLRLLWFVIHHYSHAECVLGTRHVLSGAKLLGSQFIWSGTWLVTSEVSVDKGNILIHILD